MSAKTTVETGRKFSLSLTTFQRELLREALEEYREDGDTTQDWYTETSELLEQLKE
jgi:hypothetical protein